MESCTITQVLVSIENREVAPEGLDASLLFLDNFEINHESKARACGMSSKFIIEKEK
jgi:hypothetical protein